MKPIFAIFLFMLTFTADIKPQNSWQKIGDADGILTYQKSNGARILEVKGVVILHASIDVAGNIFRSIDLHPKWVGYCEKTELIELVDRNHYKFYEILSPPWPVSKRDLVIEAVSEYFNRELYVTILSQATSNEKKPVTKEFVRIHNMKVRVSIEYIAPDKTGIVYEIIVDPGGNIPDFIINMFNQIYVYQIMANLRKIATDEVYTNNIDSTEDALLLSKLLSNKNILQNTLKHRLSRFIDSRINIEYLIYDDLFLNLWLKNSNHLAEKLFLGNHDADQNNEAQKIIIESYLERYTFSRDIRQRLSANPEIQSIFRKEIIKDALTPELLQKVLSGKS